MFQTLNTAGYDLYKLPNHPDLWSVDSKSTEPYSGSLLQVVKYMLNSLGFRMVHILEGIDILAPNLENEHDSIHFGCMKTPMFTYKKEENYGKRAS